MADPVFRSATSAATSAESVDSTISVETPEGIEFVLFPAGPAIRACAWGIDQAIQWMLIIAIFTVSGFFENAGGGWMLLLMLFGIEWFYHILWENFGGGQSPGKRLLGIRVVRGNGSPVNPGASFLRNLLRFADTFLFLCPIALVTMLLSQGYRRLGDWAADTLVVYTARSLPGQGPAGRGAPASSAETSAAGADAAVPASLSGEEKQGILMFARRYTLLGRARAGEIALPYVKALRGADELPPEDAADYLLGIGQRISGGRRTGGRRIFGK
ncbi:MAG: RDD family protein [Treponema sp.]|jgi:uncharacterized RDD family membrane protein YckC|nr:RDD family protein [Treponema sp.]